MTLYTIKVRRKAEATLEIEIPVEGTSREAAERAALYSAERDFPASSFTVTSIDLTSHEGSSEVVR